MDINLVESGNTRTPGNYFIGAIYDPSAPTVVVQSIVLPGPYTSPIPFAFTGLADQIWNFILWENTTPTVGGIGSNPFSFRPTNNTIQVRADLELVADISVNFASGTNSYTADMPNDLTGWQYSLERVGQGTLQLGVDWAPDADGFHLLVAGDEFGPKEKFVLHFLPQTSTTAPPPAVTGIIVVPQVITASLALTNSFTGKLGLIQGATASLIITLPTLASMSDNKVIGFNSAGGSHINAVLACAGADTILWASGAGGTVSQLVLGQNEQIQLFKAGGVWNALSVSDTVRMAGEIIYEYTIQKLNTVLANGTLLSRTTYARLWNYVNNLPITQLVVDAAWANTAVIGGITYFVNKGKYTTGDGSGTNFRVPNLFLYGFLRGVDGATRFPGDLQGDALRDHQHDSLIGAIGGAPNGTGPLKNGGIYGGPKNTITDLSGHPCLPSGAALPQISATETRSINNGAYALIRS